ncbi:hypothetical protein [Megasphaera vaginalis (ex Srinivasan et al. 2021)]|jgi:hypothetical protein|uniref:Uncharacterized protein n=1 Tax=Megasphaera vaginalis (ex Srinivasan et al. 2021) TaxID=1111454 RepID=U7USF4_9FIRM|nr:hypothetical protein [Megasphaera vaginalis (ex Srinivasan et al. 2021)]ERT62382.1 hypothetical protein HMPREF1250_0241 [Megasphaera vaginalis (ex Srinivasan et al. 2021)]
MAKSYKDPTGDLAVGRVYKEAKVKRQLFKKAVMLLAFVCDFKIKIEFIERRKG